MLAKNLIKRMLKFCFLQIQESRGNRQNTFENTRMKRRAAAYGELLGGTHVRRLDSLL
jgi:hypothetical protein